MDVLCGCIVWMCCVDVLCGRPDNLFSAKGTFYGDLVLNCNYFNMFIKLLPLSSSLFFTLIPFFRHAH